MPIQIVLSALEICSVLITIYIASGSVASVNLMNEERQKSDRNL